MQELSSAEDILNRVCFEVIVRVVEFWFPHYFEKQRPLNEIFGNQQGFAIGQSKFGL